MSSLLIIRDVTRIFNAIDGSFAVVFFFIEKSILLKIIFNYCLITIFYILLLKYFYNLNKEKFLMKKARKYFFSTQVRNNAYGCLKIYFMLKIHIPNY